MNILIADDSLITRAVIVKTLELAKVNATEIFHVSNGREALLILRQHKVDIIFSDLNMPVMNGVAFIAEKNQDPALVQIPVVVVSTDGSTARMEQLKACGVRGFVRKPFRPEVLRKVILDILGVCA